MEEILNHLLKVFTADSQWSGEEVMVQKPRAEMYTVRLKNSKSKAEAKF